MRLHGFLHSHHDQERLHVPEPYLMKGWEELQDYIARAPKDRLEHFSPLARIKAKVTFTRTPEDDGFRVLEILSVPKLCGRLDERLPATGRT